MGRVIALWLLAASTSPALAAQPYTVVVLHPAGYDRSIGRGIGGGRQVGYAVSAGTGNHAILWNGSPGNYVDLTPGGAGYAYATDGLQQVGEANAHAASWTGTADSLVDLHPAGGWDTSAAYGVGGGQQVGSAGSPAMRHAIVWSGTAQSAVDLHPAGFSQSFASGTNGSYQVGYGYTTAGFLPHALLWHGSAESAVDLTPAGSIVAFANAISGSQIVGRYEVFSQPDQIEQTHAIIWNDLGASFSDLNPTGYGDSELLATSGEWQAGDVGGTLAFAWHGTAESAVNLHALLPAGFRFSQANGVDAAGNVVGQAYDEVSGRTYAVLWLVPEPPAGLVFVACATARLRRRPPR
jgi:hypothetical protein